MNNDDLVEKLGRSQQRVMSLTVQKRELERRLEKVEERAEELEELVVEVVGYLERNVLRAVVLKRIAKVMQKLEGHVE